MSEPAEASKKKGGTEAFPALGLGGVDGGPVAGEMEGIGVQRGCWGDLLLVDWYSICCCCFFFLLLSLPSVL